MKAFLLILIMATSSLAHAVEYYELEVYGYQTAGEHELEIENTTSSSSDAEDRFVSHILRSSFEFNYGLTDRWEVTAYLDYTKPYDANTEFTAFRAHARTHFFEKDEMPVDLGAYFEVELPRNYRQEDVAIEFRPIIEKDFYRFTVDVNPMVELAHALAEEDETGGDGDGDVVASGPAPSKSWRLEYGMAVSLAYNFSESIRPHLDWHMGFNDKSSLLMPAVDLRIIKGLNLTLGAGFGQNDHTEKRIGMARIEFETYF